MLNLHDKIKVKIIMFLCALCISNNVRSAALGDYPPSISELTFSSQGSKMSGIAYLAAGAGPHPTVLLLHGYPGNEKNLDVAQAIRRAGWNVVFFHYRGAWGSEGEFSFRGAEQDVQVVLNYLHDKQNAANLRVDTNRISLVGHSMGGHMAIAGILDYPIAKCAVSYDGANLGASGTGIFSDPDTAAMWRNYSDSLFMLNGWSGEKAQNEIVKHADELDLVKRAHTINGRPVLFIAANTNVIPIGVHITPLLNALKATKNSQISYLLIEDDHSFSASREKLIASTIKFLNKNCR